MLYLLVKNEVKDFEHWLGVFNTDRPAAEAHGLFVERVWQDADDPGIAFFLMRAKTREQALAFMARPESAEVGLSAGVTGGEYHFLRDV